jgi:hypothetical protein
MPNELLVDSRDDGRAGTNQKQNLSIPCTSEITSFVYTRVLEYTHLKKTSDMFVVVDWTEEVK